MTASASHLTWEGVLTEDEARELIAQASGRLRHRWLWQDIAIPDWQAALHAFERAARSVLGSGPPERLEGNPDAVGVAAYTSGMGPLLGLWIENGQLTATPEVSAVLALHLHHNRARMRAMHYRARHLIDALAAKGVRPLVMKGMHTAFEYFPEPGARPLTDIDLLVGHDQYGKASEALRDAGLVPSSQFRFPDEIGWRDPLARSMPMTMRYLHEQDPWPVDVHRDLDCKCTPGAPIIQLAECGDAGGTVSWTLSPAARQMNPSALTLYLLVHAGYGLESLTLLRTFELVVVARASGASAPDFDVVEAMARRAGAIAAIFPAVVMLEEIAPGTLPGRLVEASRHAAPRSVQRQMEQLSPATAQCVVRTSVAERFMWTPSLLGIARHLWEDVTMAGLPAGERGALIKHRINRLARMLAVR
jgi:hypothetical protein